MAELTERLSWEEWLGWQAWWQLDPWGDWRADLRQAVSVSYALAPYLPKTAELPGLQWPYFEGGEEPDWEAVQAAAEAERVRWADWERTRPRVFSGKQVLRPKS